MSRPALAPLGIGRVACWPIGSIERLAVVGGTSEHAMSIERARLWEQTAAAPAFLCALAVANPALARSLMHRELPAVRNKRARHLDTTLYRYLARAATRPEPNGLWCGAVVVSFGPERALKPAARTLTVTADLAPFRALARRADFAGARYSLNGSLSATADGGFDFLTPPDAGPAVPRRVRGVAVARAIEALAGRAVGLDLAAERIAKATGASEPACARLVTALRDAGVLVPHPAFPAFYSDGWSALEALADGMTLSDAPRIRRAASELRPLADALSEAIAQERPSAICDALEAANAAVDRCLSSFDSPRSTRAALRCDATAPFTVQLCYADRERIAAVAARYAAYQSEHGHRHAVRQALLDDVVGAGAALPECRVDRLHPRCELDTWEDVARWFSSAPALAHQVARRARAEALAEERVVLDGSRRGSSGHWPLEAARFSFDGTDDRIRFGGLSVDATAGFARVAASFGDRGEELVRWFRGSILQAQRETGVELVELAVDSSAPNVRIAPSLFPERFDLCGGTRHDALRLERLGTGGVLLRRETGGPMRAAFSPSAATIGRGDHATSLLLLTSGRLPPAFELMAPVYGYELERVRFSPRVELGDGTVVRGRRTVLHGEELQRLTALRGAARVEGWRRLADRLGWPPMVNVRREGGPALCIHRDSAIAVEAAFEGAGACRRLLVEEMTHGAWVRGAGGAHVAEIVMPLVWERHALSGAIVESDQRGAA